MEISPFQYFIYTMSDEQLERLAYGELGIGCDDEGYRLVENGINPLDESAADTGVRETLRQRESEVQQQLGRLSPLCRAEFDYQAARLLEAHGAGKFCRSPDRPQALSLMIDEAHLVVVGPEDARSQYGYFCECGEHVSGEEAEARVWRWLESGAAYDDYRSKTTCRYC